MARRGVAWQGHHLKAVTDEREQMRIITELTGTTPLIMHNVRLARPDDDFVRAIAKITSKGSKMTLDDREEVARLEFAGGLYIDEDGPYLPYANVRRCFQKAATVRKLGTHVQRALLQTALNARLIYPGPREVEKLWGDETYRYSTVVGIQRAKTVRMRPWFPHWTATFEWELLTETLDLEEMVSIIGSAGRIEGVGDNRVNGFGRFHAKVTQA